MTRSAINDAIRRAAGRNVGRAPARELELEQPVGSIGIGRGGAARPQPTRTTSAEISDAIRVAAHRAQNRVDLDGVNLEDVLGR
jgi:hypothetical protein